MLPILDQYQHQSFHVFPEYQTEIHLLSGFDDLADFVEDFVEGFDVLGSRMATVDFHAFLYLIKE